MTNVERLKDELEKADEEILSLQRTIWRLEDENEMLRAKVAKLELDLTDLSSYD